MNYEWLDPFSRGCSYKSKHLPWFHTKTLKGPTLESGQSTIIKRTTRSPLSVGGPGLTTNPFYRYQGTDDIYRPILRWQYPKSKTSEFTNYQGGRTHYEYPSPSSYHSVDLSTDRLYTKIP
ncbi:hypothetical protein YC2023_082207 [Brassica napus]